MQFGLLLIGNDVRVDDVVDVRAVQRSNHIGLRDDDQIVASNKRNDAPDAIDRS